ncbi:MAG: polyamine aminopropyltransferase [Pirellulaceae bacterium]|nr:polyamine aminopropyltransferase [Pirellulaceae bacterium]
MQTCNIIDDNQSKWFIEGTVPGQRHGNVNHGLRITELLCHTRTQFQECLIFENPVYGRVLVLDGIVQLSTFDEHIYHEMLVHPPMLTHPNPQRVLIIGGGDGGTLREVLQHNPAEVVMIDIDEEFVRLAAEHLPSLSQGAFSDPRVKLRYEDASQALREYENAFDVAIIDCNDAIGPSTVLFEEEFYSTVNHALKPNGVCAVQAGSLLDNDFIDKIRQRIELNLGTIANLRLTIPSYHCGEYLFLMASRTHAPSGPQVESLKKLQDRRNLVTKYWTAEIHHASQIMTPGCTVPC